MKHVSHAQLQTCVKGITPKFPRVLIAIPNKPAGITIYSTHATTAYSLGIADVHILPEQGLIAGYNKRC
jgi:hypothetical protein